MTPKYDQKQDKNIKRARLSCQQSIKRVKSLEKNTES